MLRYCIALRNLFLVAIIVLSGEKPSGFVPFAFYTSSGGVDPFDFIDVPGAASLTIYYVTSAPMAGFSGSKSVSVSGADAQIRKNNSGSWVGNITVAAGDVINLRMTSSANPSTVLTANVTIEGTTVDWNVDTTSATSYHYFVRTADTNSSGGNFGGLEGANSFCLSDLQANDWLGKSNVTLDASTVKAWLCDGVVCQDLMANTQYTFARSGNISVGGASFTTNSLAQGPSNNVTWDGATHFGESGNAYRTGRAEGTDTLWSTISHADNCNGWTNISGTGRQGRSTNETPVTRRWSQSSNSCANNRRIICVVDNNNGVDSAPDEFDFVDQFGVPTSNPIEQNVQVAGFVGPVFAAVTGGGEIRVNNSGAWVTSGLSVLPGDLLNIRVTSSSSSLVETLMTVTVGSTTADWRVTTGDGNVRILLTAGSTWMVPGDWNNSANSIECIGGGGGGYTRTTGGGGGGGGGAYAAVTNLTLTPSSIINIQIGAGGDTAGTDGTDTFFNGTSCSTSSVCAKGGGSPTSGSGENGGSASSSVGAVKYRGGDGGNGSVAYSGGGGGGAAGPNGAGKSGGNSVNAGAGGGGHGGGSNGANTSSDNGADGGGNHSGSGVGTGSVQGATATGSGFNGGGGGGAGRDAGPAGHGGAGSDIFGANVALLPSGSGGGGGAAGRNSGNAGNGGLYGAGGGGGGLNNNAGVGAQGACWVTYSP